MTLTMATATARADVIYDDPGTTPELDAPNELGPGRCSPETLAVDQVTTCTFPLIGATEYPEFFEIHAEVVGRSHLKSGRCRIDAGSLVCPDLPVGYDRGELQIGFESLGPGEPLATVSVDRTGDGVFGLVVVTLRVQPVFAGAPTTMEVFRASSLADDATADLLLRRAGDDTVVERVPALAAQESFGMAEFTVPGPGRWTITGCLNGETDECVKEGIRRPIHAIEPVPVPLIEDHNDPSATRINLVFVGSGFYDGEPKNVQDEAIRLLTLDGEPEVFSFDDDVPYDLGWGPFAVEPLRDNIDKFNFWYLEDGLPAGTDLFDPGQDGLNNLSVAELGLGNDVVLITLSRNGGADGSRARASLPTFADDIEVELPDSPSLGSVYLPVTPGSSFDHSTLAHEFGHAIFGLRDEYEEQGLDTAIAGYPNCASSEAEAEDYWGDLVGQLDPMYERWKEVSQANDVWYEADDRGQDFVVATVTGGCFSTSGDAFRPTARSLMNGQEPVFGAVNRFRAEQILDLWPDPPPPPPPTTSTTAPPPSSTTTIEDETATDTTATIGSQAEDGAIPILAIVVVLGVAALLGVGLALRRVR